MRGKPRPDWLGIRLAIAFAVCLAVHLLEAPLAAQTAQQELKTKRGLSFFYSTRSAQLETLGLSTTQ
jgi:hypothetical protein